MVRFVASRDLNDHVRFSPLQTTFATTVCNERKLPTDTSTAVLIDKEGGHTHSTAVLRLFRHMGLPYTLLGRVLLFVPVIIRDFGYRLFAENRGMIWKGVKKMTGMGDTTLVEFRDRIVGLEDPLDPEWGFSSEQWSDGTQKKDA